MRMVVVTLLLVLLLLVSCIPLHSFLDGTTNELKAVDASAEVDSASDKESVRGLGWPDFRDMLAGVDDSFVEAELASVRAQISVLEGTGFGDSLGGVIDRVLSLKWFVFLFFHADWCYFCEVEKPIIDELEEIYSNKVVFIRLDQAKNPEAVKMFAVKGYPTMFLIYDKTEGNYVYLRFDGFKQKEFLENSIRNAINYLFGASYTVGGLFDHHSCSFSSCVDACTDEKVSGCEFMEFVEAITGCIDPTVLTDIYGCAKAAITNEPIDVIGCAMSLLKTPKGAACAFSLGHFLGNCLGAEQLGECLGTCAADPSSYGQLCSPGAQRSRCAGVPGFIAMSECSRDCEWVHVPGSVRPCGVGYECVEGSNGAECRKDEDREDDDRDPDPDDPPAKPPTRPGNDKCDDNFDVSDLWQTWDKSPPDGNVTVSKIAVLNRGYPLISGGLVSFLRKNLNESPAIVSVGYLRYLKPMEYPVLIIPSGGFAGLSGSLNVRFYLESYVAKGGTLIVFSQQQGSDYSVLPGGEIRGFGWIEDVSCHSHAAGISSYHPLLSGLRPVGRGLGLLLDLNIDGFFTKWPRNATVLLTRVKNGMPAMILYEYGRGHVVASNLFSDWAPALSAGGWSWSTLHERILLRDLFTWAKSTAHVKTIEPEKIATVSVQFTNPIAYSPSWVRFNQSEIVSIPVNITNRGNETVTKVVFTLIDPAYYYRYVEVPTSLAPGASTVLTLNYQTTNSSKIGVWMILYTLYTVTGKTFNFYHGSFLLGMPLDEISMFKARLVLRSPLHPVRWTQEVVYNITFTFNASPSETKTLNLTFAPPRDRLGVWALDYEITTLAGIVVGRGAQYYAVSDYAENPNGWSYQSEEITFSLTSDGETYLYRDNANFTLHIWNRGDVDRNLTVLLIITAPFSNQAFKREYFELIAPAKTYVNYTYNLIITGASIVSFSIYETKAIGFPIGSGWRWVRVYHLIPLNLRISHYEYLPGQNISARVTIDTRSMPDFPSSQATLNVRIVDKNREEILHESIDVLIKPGDLATILVNFSLPIYLKQGMYTLRAQILRGIDPFGTAAEFFWVVEKLFLNIAFDKTAYRVRETLGITVAIRNAYPFQQNQTLVLSIPSLSYSNSTFVQVKLGEEKIIRFNVALPSSIEAGSYRVIATLLEKNLTSESSFTIPEANLETKINKLSFGLGEDLIITIKNSGGVDTNYAYGVILYDKYLNRMYETNGSGMLTAGNSIQVTYTFPDGTVDGTYLLYTQVFDLSKTQPITKYYYLTVNGLAAYLNAATDKEVYLITEDVTVLSSIKNLKTKISNAVLNLKISSTSKKCVVPQDDMYITEDTVFCPGTYIIPDKGSWGVIIVQADNIMLDFTGVVLDGAGSTGYGIYSGWYSNVTVKNAKIINYRRGIYINFGDNNIVVGNELTTAEPWAPGIYIGGQSNIVLNNTINGFYSGIDVNGINNVIVGNTVVDNIRGINVRRSHNIIAQNIAVHNEDGIYFVGTSSFPLLNLTVMENTIVGKRGSGGIYGEYINNGLFFNNTISMTTHYGIGLMYSNSNRVVYNSVQNNSRGIHILYFSNNNLIAYNIVENNTITGIYLYATQTIVNNTIFSNTVRFNGWYGIYVYASSTSSANNNIIANIIANTTENGIVIGPYFNSTIASNTIANNTQHGISMNSVVRYNLIVNNTITGNKQYGINPSSYTQFNLIVNNTFHFNRYGLYLTAENNTIYHNNFINNTYSQAYDGAVNPNKWDNGYPSGGNYWSNYAGVDFYSGPYQNETGSDGIGDTPYTYGMLKDNYPFMNPNAWAPYSFTAPNINFTPPSYSFPSASDYQSSQTQSGNGADNIIWETDIPVNVTNIINLNTIAGKMGVTGKLYLLATLYSSTWQVITWNTSSFYVTDTDVYLTLETDKKIYKPNENINVYGIVKNTGTSAKSITLLVTSDGTTLYNETLTLNPGETRPYQFSTTAATSFTLKGTVDNFSVTEFITIAEPQVHITTNVPTIVGRAPFTVTAEIQNRGAVSANLNITIGDSIYKITVPANETMLIQKTLSITTNTTLTIIITGDYTATINSPIIFGEAAEIKINPEPLYLQGLVDIPFEIANLGILETEFNATFTIGNQTIVKPVYLSVKGNLTDFLTFNLTKGTHILSYSTPFQQGNVTINVETPAKIIVTSFPENETYQLNQEANVTIRLRNIGGSAGEAQVTLILQGIAELTNTTWVMPNTEEELTFTFTVPDDIEEKQYKATLKVNNETYTTWFLIQGFKINVNATLDKTLYEESESATLTLIIENLRNLNMTLFARVKLGDYDSTLYFNLSSLETKTLTFEVPVTFNAGKLLFTIYLDSGRALYINALYLYQKPPKTAGISLYTDKQVYEMDEYATVHVNVTKPGRLVIIGPGLNVNTTIIAGLHNFTFQIPKLRTGTHLIRYTFENYSSTYPIDVIGYSARIIGTELDKTSYREGENLTITLLVETNKAFNGLVKVWLFNPDDLVIGEHAINFTFTAGENIVQVSIPLNTNTTGVYAIAYRIFAYGSFIFLASGSAYFDAQAADTSPPEIMHIPVTAGVENQPIRIVALVTDQTRVVEVALYYRKAGQQTYTKILMPLCPGCYDTYNCTIPASEVTTSTIEYYITATDGTYSSTHPATNPATKPHVIYIDLRPSAVTLHQPTNITANSLTLSWTQSIDADFKNYTIYMSTVQGSLGSAVQTIASKTTTSYTVTGLASNATYYFKVRVYDNGGLYADSNQVSGVTQSTQPSPSPPPSSEPTPKPSPSPEPTPFPEPTPKPEPSPSPTQPPTPAPSPQPELVPLWGAIVGLAVAVIAIAAFVMLRKKK